MVSRMGEVNCKICSLNSFEKKSYKEIVELMPMSYYEIELRLYCSHNGKTGYKENCHEIRSFTNYIISEE